MNQNEFLFVWAWTVGLLVAAVCASLLACAYLAG